MNQWAKDAVFYHIYPLGCLGAPERNPFDGAAVDRLSGLHDWTDYLADLGIDAVYLGPVFESSAHGAMTRSTTSRSTAGWATTRTWPCSAGDCAAAACA